MSNEKATPRQKMIGMMYLVLTCLLAMNVSKDILKGFITVNESLERTNKNFTDNTQKLLASMQASISSGHPDIQPYYVKSLEVKSLTSKMDEYIKTMKAQVQQYTEDEPGADTMRLRFVEHLDNFDKPTYFLIGDDEHKPKTDGFSALQLRNKLKELSTNLIAIVDKMQKDPNLMLPLNDYTTVKQKIASLTPVDPQEKEDDVPVTWEIQNFNHLPLAAVITNLSKIQADVHNVEAEMIATFAGASGKLTINVDTLMPRVVAKSDYVQLGQTYSADVFLSASSSGFTDENLQIVLGDMDQKTGTPAGNAQKLQLVAGTAKIQLPANTVGHQKYRGMIKYKDGRGIYKYFPFEKEYIVAPPAVAVSPDKMNVFYTGVPNPITISAAGIAPQDLVVKLSDPHAQLTSIGNGKYEVFTTNPGACDVIVSAKTTDGIKQQGLPVKFRVKQLPTPVASASGYSGPNVIDIPLKDAQYISSIAADLKNFEFSTRFVVKSFEIDLISDGVSKGSEKSNNNQVPQQIKPQLARCKRGSKIFITNIKAEGPDKKIYALNALTLKVK